MKQTLLKVLLAAAIGGAGLLLPSCARAQDGAVGTNVALHGKVSFTPPSNYQYTKSRDPQQLTDGVYASSKAKWDPVHQTSSLWVQEGCISWAHKKPIIINIDMGKVQPIAGLIYSTAAGKAGVVWPEHVYAAASDDGKIWHYVGDLTQLSKQQPPAEGYANLRYIAEGLKTHGRYVSIGVMQDFVVSIDEIEVLRGADALLTQSAGREIPEMEEFVAHEAVTIKARRRQNADIDAVRALINQSPLSAAQKSTFAARLDKDAQATEAMDPLPADFKTIIPLTDTHRDILAVHGEALAEQGFAPLTAWKMHRYAWLPLIHQPDKKQNAALDFSMLRNQFRSDSVLLTNASGKPMTVNITLQNAPRAAQNGWLQLDSAIWTDTYAGIPVQDALLPMAQQNGAYTLEIPAGITAKIWATIDSSKLAAGSYKSTFMVSGAGQKISVPLNVRISRIAMPTPRLSLTTWDYTDGKGAYGITEKNRDAAIKLMRSHYLDSPWARGWTLPTPKETDFNADNQLIKPLDFSTFEQWIAMWPDARNYMIFYNARERDDFAGAKMGTPEFEAKINSWIKAVVADAKTQGVEASRLVFCPVDETRSDSNDEHLLLWGKAIKKAAPAVRIFSDPIWTNPENAQHPEAASFVDILCPHPNWENDYYVKVAHQNKQELWFYNGPGLHHTGDPQLAYRQMAWRVFASGGQGMGFWSFGDLSGARTSWNAYTAAKLIYAPAYIEENTVYNSLHWDATREGVEDFEELSMLQDAITQSKNPALKSQAQKVLSDAVKAANSIASEGSVDDDKGIYDWNRNIDPTVTDAQLAKVREMLEQMNG